MSERLSSAETVSVIVSCYNNWRTLEKTLWSLEVQTDPDFEVILADDGSGEAFTAGLEGYLPGSRLRLTRVWHEDSGYRKAAILNKAIGAARGRYLLFTDGDIIVREDWVAAHRRLARSGRYFAGGSHINISRAVHPLLDRQAIAAQLPFDTRRLLQAGQADARRHRWRLESRGWKACLLDRLTPRRDRFVGCNSGCWRSDALAVGGFDETFGYSSEDRDFGVRLANAGIRGARRRYTLACCHLEHDRPYLNRDEVRRCRELIRTRARTGVTRWRD